MPLADLIGSGHHQVAHEHLIWPILNPRQPVPKPHRAIPMRRPDASKATSATIEVVRNAG